MATTPFPVTVHPYPSKVKHACAYELGSSLARNALIFVGGLGDGPHTVPYVRTVAAKIEADTGISYSVFEIRIRSSFCGFGWNNLAKDVQDISSLVKYLRGIGKEKVVLMGHSTGSQDCIEYNDYEKHQNEPIDGFILQGSVSDREGFVVDLGKDEADRMVALATEMVNDGRKDDAVPKSRLPRPFFPWPVTAYRLQSLAGVGGDDDYFSSDIPDEKLVTIWGRVKQPIMVVPSAEDQYVPKTVNFEKLLAKWKSFCPSMSDLSGLIPGANHTVDSQESQDWLGDRVVSFLKSLEGLN
ncbi:putative dolichol-phosphate mannosyltransferase [Diaporthe ampelina]|uniref:Putative dolichol-phosphate mannosyltransferase n=1 Tax=Diaporthe ampelina TaxID=1214573 RepID=A0A0G2HMC5_9PEZI|nr:putative dolichol-phosphate mannosyltransferase [Diaporthe ampelina]